MLRVNLVRSRALQVRANGFIVFVPKYGIEGPVYLTEKRADAEAAWTMDEAKQTVASADGATRCSPPRTLPGVCMHDADQVRASLKAACFTLELRKRLPLLMGLAPERASRNVPLQISVVAKQDHGQAGTEHPHPTRSSRFQYNAGVPWPGLQCLCRYTVFDKVAVNIRVEEGQHGRRTLVLSLTSREQLPESELVA